MGMRDLPDMYARGLRAYISSKSREFNFRLNMINKCKPTINSGFVVQSGIIFQGTVSLFSGMHHICIPAFPFDLPTQSGTYLNVPLYVGRSKGKVRYVPLCVGVSKGKAGIQM